MYIPHDMEIKHCSDDTFVVTLVYSEGDPLVYTAKSFSSLVARLAYSFGQIEVQPETMENFYVRLEADLIDENDE